MLFIQTTILGYQNTKDAILRHFDPEDKIKFKDLQGGPFTAATFSIPAASNFIKRTGIVFFNLLRKRSCCVFFLGKYKK